MGEQPEEWIEQISAGQHDGGDRACDDGNRPCGLPKIGMGAALCQQGQERQERHHGHVLEQENSKRALSITVLQLSAIFQDLQCNRGRRHGER